MGTSIELLAGPVALAYAKNNMGLDFGWLYQEGDLAECNSDEIDSQGFDREAQETISECFSRSLGSIIPRLHAMGQTIEAARAEYDSVVAEALDLRLDEDEPPQYLTFDEFCDLANLIPLVDLSDGYSRDETVAKGRFASHAAEIQRLPWIGGNDFYWSEATYVADTIVILSPESMLQVFALREENLEAPVCWDFGPIVHAGWVEREQFVAGARRQDKVLVVTEGASDAHILRRMVDLLAPEVSDFFWFLDGEERHHFWGTGNMVKFAEGLQRIDIQNRILFVLDNDAEGVFAHGRLEALGLSANLGATILPALDEFKSFPARGPDGEVACDINGRAAAIECYLDLELDGRDPARVIWSNYKKEMDQWHGVLEYKESYSRHFFDQSDEGLLGEGYDTSKIELAIRTIIDAAEGLVTLQRN